MAHHVTDANPTHPASECAATYEMHLTDPPQGYPRLLRWFHMCGEPAGHDDLHECGVCGARYP